MLRVIYGYRSEHDLFRATAKAIIGATTDPIPRTGTSTASRTEGTRR